MKQKIQIDPLTRITKGTHNLVQVYKLQRRMHLIFNICYWETTYCCSMMSFNGHTIDYLKNRMLSGEAYKNSLKVKKLPF